MITGRKLILERITTRCSTFILVEVRTMEPEPMPWVKIAEALHRSVQAWHRNYQVVRDSFGPTVTLRALAEKMDDNPDWVYFFALNTLLHQRGINDLRLSKLDAAGLPSETFFSQPDDDLLVDFVQR